MPTRARVAGPAELRDEGVTVKKSDQGWRARVSSLATRDAALQKRVAKLERQVAHLMRTVEEDRRLQRRVAELIDVVEQELLRRPLDEDAAPTREQD